MHSTRHLSGVRQPGFTLIELLVVVAIIAILAAIAVPNFLDAQIRAKVARVKADFYGIATALETYRIDHNRLLETNINERWQRFEPLTTPIAYLSCSPYDIFLPRSKWREENTEEWGPRHGFYKLGCTPEKSPKRWALSSNAPDLDEDSVPIRHYPGWSEAVFLGYDPEFRYMIYDPSNGTTSNGDIWRLSDHQFQ